LIRFARRALGGVLVIFVVFASVEFVLVTAGVSRPIEAPPPIVIWNQKKDEVIRGGSTMFRFDPHLFWDLAPGALTANSRDEMINPAGFRGAVLDVVKPPGTFRVACLGDSSTFGVFCRAGEAYPALLETILASKRKPAESAAVEVLNAGVPGYTVFQGKVAFERKVAPYRPDVVVAMFGAINDEISAKGRVTDAEKASRLLYPGLLDRAARFLSRYRTVQLLASLAPRREIPEGRAERKAFKEEHLAGREETPRVGVAEFSRLSTLLVESAQRSGADVILLGPPRTPGLLERYPDLRAYNASLADVARSRGVAFLDLEPIFLADLSLFIDEVHPTPEGHRLIAERLAEMIP